MREVTKEQHDTPPDQEWVKAVCSLGTGSKTCRYLAAGGRGFSCEKLTDLRAHIDQRVQAKTMNALGDNCTGRSPA